MPNLNWLPVDCQHALRVFTISPAALKSSVPREVCRAGGVSNGMGPQCKHLLTLMPWRKQTARRRVEKCSMATASLQYTYTVMWAQIAIHTHKHTYMHIQAQRRASAWKLSIQKLQLKIKAKNCHSQWRWSGALACLRCFLGSSTHTNTHKHTCTHTLAFSVHWSATVLLFKPQLATGCSRLKFLLSALLNTLADFSLCWERLI